MSGVVGSVSFKLLLVDGIDLLGAKPKGFLFSQQAMKQRTDGLGDSTMTNGPTGMSQVTAAQNGAFFNDATNGMHESLKTPPTSPQGTPRVMMIGFAGNSIGKPFVGLSGNYILRYGVLGKTANLTEANTAHEIVALPEWGTLLQEYAARTADWNTKTDGNPVDYTTDTQQRVIPITSNTAASPSVVTTPVPHGLTTGDVILIAGVSSSNADINGERTVTVITPTTFSVAVNATTHAGTGGSFVRSNTSFGGVGYLAVAACSGFTNFVGKIKGSTDNSTFTDLLTFTDNVTAPFAERKTVAGTIPRYLAFDGDVTGSGSITLCVGFSRNQS